ncbi:MAG: hypothetical protein QOD09_1006 [Bradyrhizobium sp.]|nr:hypothetical protein [Bradyrhizobium sp.]
MKMLAPFGLEYYRAHLRGGWNGPGVLVSHRSRLAVNGEHLGIAAVLSCGYTGVRNFLYRSCTAASAWLFSGSVTGSPLSADRSAPR